MVLVKAKGRVICYLVTNTGPGAASFRLTVGEARDRPGRNSGRIKRRDRFTLDGVNVTAAIRQTRMVLTEQLAAGETAVLEQRIAPRGRVSNRRVQNQR